MGVPVHINIEEIRKPDLDARLVAQNVAQQLERRVMFRRAMKRVVQNAMRQGAEGIKVQVSGRLVAPRSRAPSGIARAACPCTRCVRTSTTPPTRRRPPTASSA
jgi:ribosomal protein S3